MRRVTFGVNLPDLNGYPEIRRVALESENLGFTHLWYCDHIWSRSPECWSLFAALAGETKRIRLGSAVTCNLWREPTMTAKLAATVDVISDGRVEFGLGGGHTKREYDTYGVRFPRFRERMEMLDEALQITKSLWTKKSTTFTGKHYSLVDAFCEPLPVQKPHPPIMIGGGGLTFTPGIAARHANSYNPNADALSIENARTYLAALERECKVVGRNPEEIEKIWYGVFFVSSDPDQLSAVKRKLRQPFDTTIIGTPEDCVERVQAYRELGFTHFILYTSPYYRDFNLDPVPVMGRFSDQVVSHFR